MSDYFATLARYHRWASERLLESIAPLSDEDYRRDVGLFFDSIHGTLNHLVVTDDLWFARFSEGRSPVIAHDAEASSDRDEVARLLLAAVGRWDGFVASIPPTRYGERFDYRTMRGSDVSLPFAATLGHVFNHGTHHRGQITAAISGAGAKTPELDLVYMLQQEQPT
ncbi:MAG: DinB family protein [Burkholderiaceae bacterium]